MLKGVKFVFQPLFLVINIINDAIKTSADTLPTFYFILFLKRKNDVGRQVNIYMLSKEGLEASILSLSLKVNILHSLLPHNINILLFQNGLKNITINNNADNNYCKLINRDNRGFVFIL